jgi:MOSC domain-containing protein YiiM
MSVLCVARSSSHSFSKGPASSITLVANYGVQGDAHAGQAVQHRTLQQTGAPNLRQVHLIASETSSLAGLAVGKDISPGDLGENISTAGIDLFSLGKGTKLHFVGADGAEGPVISLTGFREPGPLFDWFHEGLREKFISAVGRQAGVMAVVQRGGDVKPGMKITVERPAVHQPLESV